MTFWNTLPRPIIALAPLANVTDASFRRIIAKYSKHIRRDGSVGGPDVMWTEFVSADGLVRADEEGKQKLLADLMFTDEERPIVAQIFSVNPQYIKEAAQLCVGLGFDGIDINMGCPDRTIEKQGAGASLIKNPELAGEIVRAAKQGAGALPVSIKTRIGYHKNELETWLPALLAEHPAAITIHARTRKELSKVPAHWESITEAVRIRDEVQGEEWQKNNPKYQKTLILGNGDVYSLDDAFAKARKTGADGVMLGRAIFGNPWLFLPEEQSRALTLSLRLRVMCEHTRLFEELLPFKNFALMKKHYKAYVNNFDGAKELRTALMEKNSGDEIEAVVNRFLKEQDK